MTPPAAPRRARILGISVLSAVFVAGALAGAASGRLLDAREASAALVPATEAPAAEDKTCGERKRLVDQVDLSPTQRQQVDSIVERRRAQREEFWDNEGQRMRAIMDSTRNEIRAVMMPEQRAEYDRLVADHRARNAARDSVQKAERAARARQ